MVILELTKEQARKLYDYADNDIKVLLEKICGKSILTNVMERVKTYEDACKELGIEPYDENKLMSFGLTKNDIAYQKLVVVVEALNEGWKPDVCDSNVNRWYPWFRTNDSSSSFAFSGSNFGSEHAHAGSGSRLALKSAELSNYFGEQFIELWKEFII